MVIPSNFACSDSTRSSDKRSSGKLPSQEPTALSSPFLLADNMRDFNISRRSSDTVAVFTPCPIHCQGYRRPIFPTSLATDTTPGLATDAQARRNISHYRLHCQYDGVPLIPVIPANWGGPRLHGNDGRRRRTQAATGAPTILIPATARGRRMGSRLHGNDGRTREAAGIHGTHIVIPAEAGIHGGGPAAMGPRLHGNDGRTHSRHPRDGARAAMGSRLHGNDDGHPQSLSPRRREGGDGFPSPRERRWAPTIVIPATAGGRRWVPVCTGTTGAPGRRRESTATHDRHSREGGNPRRGAGGWVPVSTGTTVGGSQVISE